MSSIAVGNGRRSRDPGRLYPPPPVGVWGWILRWGITVLGLGGMLGIFVIAVKALIPEMSSLLEPWRLGVDILLTVGAAVAINFRRRWPLAVGTGIIAATALSLGASCFLPWVFISVATRRRWREVALMVVAGLLAQTAFGFSPWGDFNGPQPSGNPVDMVVNVAIQTIMGAMFLAILTAVGFYTGARRDLLASLRERAETAEAQQRLQVQAAQSEERARIAREMHDVLAHRISLVSMHAGVLAYRDNLSPEQSREIAGIIQENAHASLTELRQVLSTLRQPGDSGVQAPQPTVADVPALVDEATAAGNPVTLTDEIRDVASVPAPIGRHAYRILQEALTNVRKHAIGAPVTVRMSGRAGKGLTLEVRNPVTHASDVPGAKLGLLGLAERAQLIGGSFEAGTEQGDFVVRAWLPWEK